MFARLTHSARLAGQAFRALSSGYVPGHSASTSSATTASYSLPTVTDFQGGGFFVQRRMTPAEVRCTLERATMGDLAAQWELFALMEDTWPRLAKNLAELRRAAARATYTVQPCAARGSAPTAPARDRATLVDHGLRQWWPKPGTLELSFEDTLFHALDAYGKGVSVLELHWQQTPSGLLPRSSHVLSPRRYGWNPAGTELGLTLPQYPTSPRPSIPASQFSVSPYSQLSSPNSQLLPTRSAPLATSALPTAWQSFPADQFLIGIWQARTGAPGATAVLRALAPYWAGVTFGWEWLLSNAQIFGVPFRWANFDRNQPQLGAQLRDMLAAMGASGYGAFPEGTKLEFKEASQNVTGNPQVVVQELADKACDLLILGQELSGGAQAAGLGGGAASLQQAVRADRLHATAQWCADLLNYQLVPALLRANYGDTVEAPVIVPDLDPEPDALKLAQRDEILLRAGLPLPRQWFYQRHGIPEPAAGDPVLLGAQPPSAVSPGSAGGPPASTNVSESPTHTLTIP